MVLGDRGPENGQFGCQHRQTPDCGVRPTVTLPLISNDSLSSPSDAFHSVPPSSVPPCGSCACPDELYAQKLKYKAISEELDHALNDMTSI